MKITDPYFEAKLVRYTPEGTHDVGTLPEAEAVFFYCPCGYGKPTSDGTHGLLIPFETKHPKGWKMSGTSLEDLTLEPSLLIGCYESQPPCWHGYLTAGEFRSC